MFCQQTPSQILAETDGNSSSDQLMPRVLDAIKSLGGSVQGDSQADILQTLRTCEAIPPNTPSRPLRRALYKLVTTTCDLKYSRANQDMCFEVSTRSYRVVR